MNKAKTTLLLLVMFTLISTSLEAQNIMKKEIDSKYKDYTDSLKKVPYPWRLPILGQKLRSKGFDIPYPNGIMVNTYFAKQQITLKNLAIGTEDDPSTFTDVSNIVRFESIEPVVIGANFRYDFWLLPFLDLYVMAGYVSSDSYIKMALPFEMSFVSHGKGPNVGWGVAFAGGVGSFILTADYNMIWTFLPQLTAPAVASVMDIRVGHNFKFPKRPQSSITVLIGAQYQKLNSYNEGAVNLSELTGISPEEKENASGQLDDWYDELPQNQQKIFSGLYDKLNTWLSNEGDSYLYYSFDKSLYYPWSMTVGANYQISHRYTFMAMYTFLGSREQLVLSFNYRFGIKGKNILHGVTF